MKELTVPPAGLRDPNALEMLRVWIAEKELHCTLRAGLYQDGTSVPEAEAWGVILADAIRHISIALEVRYGIGRSKTVEEIKWFLLKELGEPSSAVYGAFVQPKTAQ